MNIHSPSRIAARDEGSSGPDALTGNLYQLFVRQAQARPDAIAVVTGTVDTTYQALARRAHQIAGFLHRHGLQPEQPVGVLMDRSADMLAAMLAILGAGGAYVPLDPEDPPGRQRRILILSGCRLILGDPGRADALRSVLGDVPESMPEFVTMECIGDPEPGSAVPPISPGGNRLAYILFTSGSTGEPKGVEVEHASVLNLLVATRDLIQFTAQDRFLAASTIGFDISVAELFLPLITGGSLLLRDRRIWLDPRKLAEEVRRFAVTVVQTGPSVWSVVLAEVPDFPRVRVAITTAEPVPPALARRLLACGEQVWNLYGPTETTVWATGHRLDTDPATRDGLPGGESAISSPIGMPLGDTTVLILDDTGRRITDGEPGELCIGGTCVARGYRGNPSLTRERFVELGTGGERYYRTGDLVARSPGGPLLYFGRNDDQLKIRGIRIEPREVESALLHHPGVAHAAATWFPTASGARSIVAALVLRPGHRPSADELRRDLETRLPSPMIPSRFLFLDSLPLSPSGKTDRNALRQAVTDGQPRERQERLDWETRPWTETETVLAEIWRRLLRLQSVAAADHFFSIGGDSLAAVKLTAQIEARFQVPVPVEAVFQNPTLERMAARIDRERQSAAVRGDAGFIFPLVEHGGEIPIFFNEVDLKMARMGAWKIPCPLYSVAHWAQGRGFVQADSIMDLARVQLAAIRQIQPRGPYRLAGYSFGGLVTLEIARQLESEGQEVQLVFLLDPMQPTRTEGITPPSPVVRKAARSRWQWIARHLRNMSERPGEVLTYLRLGFLSRSAKNPWVQWMAYQIVHRHGHRPNPLSYWLLPRNRWPAFWYNAVRMAEHHVTRPYAGRVLAVFSDDAERKGVWHELLSPAARFHSTSAKHTALFDEPATSEWMPVLRQFIADSGNPPATPAAK